MDMKVMWAMPIPTPTPWKGSILFLGI